MKRFFLYQFPAILWASIIFILSSIHSFPTIKAPIALDKVAHTTIFFLMTLFAWRAFNNQQKVVWLKNFPLFTAFAFTCFYGISDEFHQRYVPGRTPDVNDLAFDILGGVLFVIVAWWLQRQKSARSATAEEQRV